MDENKRSTWFNSLDKRIQNAAKIVIALSILLSASLVIGKKAGNWIGFFKDALEMKQIIEEMQEASFVINGAVSGVMFKVDSLKYEINWHGIDDIPVILRRTKPYPEEADTYTFLPDIHVGQRGFWTNWNYNNEEWAFIDFDGQYVALKVVK